MRVFPSKVSSKYLAHTQKIMVMQRKHPIMSGTQAPSGTFLNEAPQKRPVHQSYELPV